MVGLGTLALAAAIVNTALILLVVRNAFDGWADLVVVLWLGLGANALVVILSTVFSPILRRAFDDRSTVPYFVASVLFPLLGYGVDYFLIARGFLR